MRTSQATSVPLPHNASLIDQQRDPVVILYREVEDMNLDATLKAHLLLFIRRHLKGYQGQDNAEQRTTIAAFLAAYVDVARCRRELHTLNRLSPKADRLAKAMRAAMDCMAKAYRLSGLERKHKQVSIRERRQIEVTPMIPQDDPDLDATERDDVS